MAPEDQVDEANELEESMAEQAAADAARQSADQPVHMHHQD